MIASPASRALAALAVATAVIVIAAPWHDAVAQVPLDGRRATDTPQVDRATPVPPPPANLDPRRLRSDAVETAPPTVTTTVPKDAPVEVNAAGTIQVDSVGTLSDGDGGFGTAMWAGTSRPIVESLLKQLPAHGGSPEMRSLARRLLLSIAAAPEGAAKPGSLIALRAGVLAEMGDIEGVNALLNATPGRGELADLMRLEAESRLLANDHPRVCQLASGQIGAGGTVDAFWQKAFIFCQSLEKEHAKAALGVALLRESGANDPAFYALVEALAGAKVAIEKLPEPTPLHLAMARAARLRLPADAVGSKRPAILRTIATSPNFPVELRLEAAERAEAMGALGADVVREIYANVPFAEADLANPISRADSKNPPLARALLFRAALLQTVPTAQAEAVVRALASSKEAGRFASTVRTFLPILTRIPAGAELGWFAPEAIRALVAVGARDAAEPWVALARTMALTNDDAKATLRELAPLARLSGNPRWDIWTKDGLAAWWENEKKKDAARDAAALLFSLFEGLDEPVPPGLWDGLLSGPQRSSIVMPQPALWYRFESAANAKRIGETVALALVILGEGGPGQANPVVMRQVLKGLRAVGLQDPARNLAIEAAVASSL